MTVDECLLDETGCPCWVIVVEKVGFVAISAIRLK